MIDSGEDKKENYGRKNSVFCAFKFETVGLSVCRCVIESYIRKWTDGVNDAERGMKLSEK